MSPVIDLSERPELRAAVLELMAQIFPQGAAQSAPRSFSEEFAALLEDNSSERILALVQDDHVLAALAWKPFELKQGLRIAATGLVVTSTEHRKKGHSRTLLQEAERRALSEGCAVMCLWSDLLEFYSKQGYVLAGSEISWDLPSAFSEEDSAPSEKITRAKPAESGWNIRRATLSDTEALTHLYSQDPYGPQRSMRLFERQLQQSDSPAWVALSAEQKIEVYALAGKGRDLRNIVHELVGEPEAFPALLQIASQELGSSDTYPRRIQFPYAHPSAPVLEALLGSGEQGAVCFAKTLDAKTLIAALNDEVSRQGFSVLSLHWLDDVNAWVLRDKKQDLFLSPDPTHLLQIFCSPWPLEELEGLPGCTLKRLQGWEPFPLYFWGADSV